MFGLLEFIRMEYCSTDVVNDFSHILSEHFYEINASMWAALSTRLVFPKGIRTPKQSPPLVNKGRTGLCGEYGVPCGIITYLTRECGRNVHDCQVVEVTSGSFEKETEGANPHSGAYDNRPEYTAKNATGLKAISCFYSAYREKKEGIPHTGNNWLCYDFKERRIVPTHCAIRTNNVDPGGPHLKSWLVETSVDGKTWREVARKEDHRKFNGPGFTGTFAVAGGGECRFIRLGNIGRNHRRNDCLSSSAWEIFGSLIE
jgi:hypothetical protein